MGEELEYKLRIPSKETYAALLTDPDVAVLAEGVWREQQMKTIYYDTLESALSKRLWTLRRRLEGNKSVVCIKTPTEQANVRGEWQVAAECIDGNSISALCKLGAPRELLQIYETAGITAVCGAEFLRKSVMLRFSDGSRAELAVDCGFLHGKTECRPLTEMELELYDGAQAEMYLFLRLLQARYGLLPEPMSKFARAKELILKSD